jgi:uncharacterized membrane protein YjfL (UPF0719 family)
MTLTTERTMTGLEHELHQLVLTIVYYVVGAALFGLTIWVTSKVLPFSLRKEIEEDQNTALAIVLGCGLIASAILISAVLR